jgi:nucleoside-diphosphate-sugar epimerase
MTESVLILGASGFIGRRLTARLAQSDWAVPVAASRRLTTGIGPDGIRRLQLDVTDARDLASALAGVSAVVNCVAGSPTDIARGAQLLAEAVVMRRGKLHVVHLSSQAVYGRAAGVVDESTPMQVDRSGYGAAKVSAERSLAACQALTILRPGIVYGPGSWWWSEQIARLLRSRRLGDLGVGGSGTCNLVHVDDVVRAVTALLRDGSRGPATFNLSTPQPITWNDYFRLYGTALGLKPVPRLSRARLAMELHVLGPPLRALELLCSGLRTRRIVPPPAIRRWLLDLCSQEIYMSVDRIRAELGFEFTPLAEGLRSTAANLLTGATPETVIAR